MENRTAKGSIKAHVSLDEGCMLPDIINISETKVADRKGVNDFKYVKDTIIVDDRGYFDCKLCITRYASLKYLMNQVQLCVQKARKHANAPPQLPFNSPKKKIFTQEYLIFET